MSSEASTSGFAAPSWEQISGLMAGDPDDCPGDMYNRRFMNWMSFLDTSSQLTDVFIPGTHESATYSMRSWLPNGPGLDSFPDYISQTQSFNLLGQLLAGIRYFDLRTEEVTEDGESVAIFHHGSSAIKDTKGRQVSPVVADQLAPFIDAFPSEFIIFDFQEISSYVGSPSWMVSQLQDIINQYLNPAKLAIPAGSVTSDLTMGDIWQGGWQYMVIFSEKAIEAATADNVAIEPWVVPRLPGNSQPIGPGRFWDPWDSTIWGGGVGGIIQAIGSNGAQWGRLASPCLYVAQAIYTPTAECPLANEASEGYAAGTFSQWALGLTNSAELNIVIRDAADWYPDVVAAVIALNIPTNVADAGQAQLQILIDASAHAQFAPQVNGTATAEYFVVNAPGPTQYSLFNTEIDCSELEPYGYTLEVGTQNLQGATTLEPEVFTDGNWGAWKDFTMPPEPLAQGEVVSWFQLKSLSNDGDNGWFRIDNGWVLQSWLTIHVQGKPFSGTSWQLTVQTVPVTPSLLCNTSG